MTITYLTPLSVPPHAQAIRGGPPEGRGSAIDPSSVIPVQVQQPDGSFRTTYVAGSAPATAEPEAASAPATAAPAETAPASPPLLRSTVIAPSEVKPPQPPPRKIRVRLSSERMGKVTVSVRDVAVSQTLVALVYPRDAESIIEPPVSSFQDPIRVDVGKDTYFCAYGDWTFELHDIFVVVLLRIPHEYTPPPPSSRPEATSLDTAIRTQRAIASSIVAKPKPTTDDGRGTAREQAASSELDDQDVLA